MTELKKTIKCHALTFWKASIKVDLLRFLLKENLQFCPINLFAPTKKVFF